MSNMGYVRFQNTSKDLVECFEHLYDVLSDEENEARDDLISTCRAIINQVYDNYPYHISIHDEEDENEN